ncbi:MAG: metal ABC transporter permease [Spirochaetaceae bacterium]|nr:metal ABC transporter permease [Spirochaetaceae bacterium]
MSLWYAFINTVLPFQWLEPNFMKNALLAMLVAAPLFGALGSFVVSNKMSFFSDAIGHSALTGIAFGVLLGIRDPLIAMVGFSLILGFAIITVKTRGKSSADTIIGVFSSTSVALGIVLLSATGNFARYQKYLIGDILSITPQEILLLAVVAAGAATLWVVMYNKMLLANLHRTLAKSRGIRVFATEQLFALLTALIVTIAIRWTGLLIINALLVLPAAAARFVTRSSRGYLLVAILISLLSSVVGLAASYYLGAASGATIVLVNGAIFLICLVAGTLRRG